MAKAARINGKTFITRKKISQMYDVVLRVPYCAAQNLLRYRKPIWYNAGRYGWNFDVYDLGYLDDGGKTGASVALVTGYRNLIGDAPEYLEYFEQLAAETQKRHFGKADCSDKVESVLHDFLAAQEPEPW